MSHIGNFVSHIKSDLTGPGAASTVDSPDGAPHDTIDEWGVFASTTEALTLTILTELLRRAGEHPEVPSSVAAIVGGVYAAELDHWRFTSKHWEPATTRFWIPDGFYGGEGDALDLTAVGQGVAAGEHLFVNTYLLGVTTFAAAGNSTYARYARTSPSTACSGKRSPAQTRPTTSDSQTTNSIASATSPRPPRAPASGSASRGAPPVASTTSHSRRSLRRSRSTQTSRDRPNAASPAPHNRGGFSPDAPTDRPG
jgi:hypothetical protein